MLVAGWFNEGDLMMLVVGWFNEGDLISADVEGQALT